MCTAATYKTKDFYFGRTLDYEFSYGETVTVTPRNFRLEFRHMGVMERHFAFIGMAHVADNYPLYYDAVNEKGLCIAGLNFVGNAHYRECREGKDNLAQWELIPWIMAQCASVSEAKALLARINLTAEPFAPQLPAQPLRVGRGGAHGACGSQSDRNAVQRAFSAGAAALDHFGQKRLDHARKRQRRNIRL